MRVALRCAQGVIRATLCLPITPCCAVARCCGQCGASLGDCQTVTAGPTLLQVRVTLTTGDVAVSTAGACLGACGSKSSIACDGTLWEWKPSCSRWSIKPPSRGLRDVLVVPFQGILIFYRF